MKLRPTLRTDRLVLRPFALSDASEVQRLAGDEAVASTTSNVPHPYEDGMAEAWIGTHQGRFEKGELVNFAITLAEDGLLVGAIGLIIRADNDRAALLTSRRVMEKLGMTREGVLRQHVKKWGVFEDNVEYGILKSEYRP